MQTILLVAEAIGSVLGSVAGAALLCWLFWEAFRAVRHPEWTAAAVLVLLALALTGKLPKSGFLNMVMMFALTAAILLWVAGRAWRKRHSNWSYRRHIAGWDR